MFETNTSWQMKVEEPKTCNTVRKDTLKQERGKLKEESGMRNKQYLG